jgi:hypothetical protein
MFEEIDADACLRVDGDGTYDAASAPALLSRLGVEAATSTSSSTR